MPQTVRGPNCLALAWSLVLRRFAGGEGKALLPGCSSATPYLVSMSGAGVLALPLQNVVLYYSVAPSQLQFIEVGKKPAPVGMMKSISNLI